MSALSAAASDEDGDTIATLRAALERARDWIAEHPDRRPISAGRMVAILTDVLAAAPQPQGEQEPVAWQRRMRTKWMRDGEWWPWQECSKEVAYDYKQAPVIDDWEYESRPLYTHPQPKRQPLTDEQINNHRLALPYDGEDLPDPWDFKQGVKAAERAHEIGGKA